MSVKADYCCLRMFFAHLLQVLPCGKLATACPFLSCLHRHSPVRWISKPFFSFYFKCPLASSVCAGCYVEGGRKRRKEKEIHLLLSSLLNRSTLLSFLSRVISTQVPGKTSSTTKRCRCFCGGETNHSFTTLGNEQQSFLGAFFGAFIVLLPKVSQTVVIRQIKEGKLLPGKKFCFVPTSSSDQL